MKRRLFPPLHVDVVDVDVRTGAAFELKPGERRTIHPPVDIVGSIGRDPRQPLSINLTTEFPKWVGRRLARQALTRMNA
ncbi:MAG: hypothetical protein QW358_04955 [Candidatus Hadarchaeum sp.]